MSALPKMTSEQLHHKINAGENIVLLDIRSMQSYAEWKIEGKGLKSINIPGSVILSGDEKELEELPEGQEIVVVCAKGQSAQKMTEHLINRGYNAAYLENGMSGWSQFYHPVLVAEDEKMKLYQVNRFAKGCLSYVIVSQGKAMVVDPSQKVDFYTEMAKKHGFTIEHVVDSHLHADHISGGVKLTQQTGASYYISSGEAKGSKLEFKPLEEYNVIRFGDVLVEVIAIPTPGHTPGSTSFFLNNQYLMSGDTIFVGGLGRPDLGGKAKEWAENLYDTVFGTISKLSEDVLVLPAHYADIKEINENGVVGATLGEIRKNNEIMRTADRESFTEQVAGAVSIAKPPNFENIIAINRGEMQVDWEQAVELEIGPNRCAAHHTN